MASLSHDGKTGRRLIQFMDRDGKRQTVRLGAVTAKDAKTVQGHIEKLVAAVFARTAVDSDTAAWVGGLDGELRERLARVGLVEPLEKLDTPTVSAWVRAYVDARTDVKPNTASNFEQAYKSVAASPIGAKRLDEVTAADADAFRIFLKAAGLGEGTVRRRCKRVRQFFAAACKANLIDKNPFAGLKCGTYADNTRFYFVSRAEAEAVLTACPDAEWRLIFALARYGGLRCPSEVLALTWADVDWGRARFMVRSEKTAHNAGGASRVVPIFPELAAYLQDAFDRAEPGQVYAITRYRGTNQNLRTQLARIIAKAGLAPWQKTFQNLRATRETELCQAFPLHVVCRWLGNTATIAAKHYLNVTEAHFAQAAGSGPDEALRNALRDGAGTGSKGQEQQTPELVGAGNYGPVQKEATPCDCKGLHSIPPTGLEPVSPG